MAPALMPDAIRLGARPLEADLAERARLTSPAILRLPDLPGNAYNCTDNIEMKTGRYMLIARRSRAKIA
jgi:hypothetical protein